MSDEESAVPEIVQAEERGVTEAEFIKKESDYYINIFSGFREKNSKVYWNWAAFFFGANWCFYRKLYKVGWIMFVLETATAFLDDFSKIFSIGVRIAFTLFANYLYMKNVDEEMTRIRRMPISEQRAYAKLKGGTSWGSVFAFIAAVILLAILIVTFTYKLGRV